MGMITGMSPSSTYNNIKDGVRALSGLPDGALHLIAGLATYLVADALIRRPRSPLPLLLVLATEGVNELSDRLIHGSWRLENTMYDVVMTVTLPLIVYFKGALVGHRRFLGS
jgi:hypothetical protein